MQKSVQHFSCHFSIAFSIYILKHAITYNWGIIIALALYDLFILSPSLSFLSPSSSCSDDHDDCDDGGGCDEWADVLIWKKKWIYMWDVGWCQRFIDCPMARKGSMERSLARVLKTVDMEEKCAHFKIMTWR